MLTSFLLAGNFLADLYTELEPKKSAAVVTLFLGEGDLSFLDWVNEEVLERELVVLGAVETRKEDTIIIILVY